VQLRTSEHFDQALAKLPDKERAKVFTTIEKLYAEPPVNSLKLRPFKGSPDLWIANINRGDRIILRMLGDGTAELLDFGEHDKTYRRWNRRK